MDPRFLNYYNRELQYLRELGGEFAKEFPKIAGRLGLDAFECADPYVERLLEGFAFLAARVQLKIDSEFPRFTEHMLEMVYPHYLAPTPSMTVLQMVPGAKLIGLADGFTLPRGSAFRSKIGRGEKTPCEYRTAHDVQLWPIEVAAISHSSYVGDIGEIKLGSRRPIKGALRITLRRMGDGPIRDLSLKSLPLFIRGQDQTAMRLHELLVGASVAIVARGSDRTWQEVIDEEPVRALGFSDDEALLPYGPQSFQGYRLLHEYFACPSRFMFAELNGLERAVKRCTTKDLEILVLLDRHDPAVESSLGLSHVVLFSTPAINLFPRTADRIQLTNRVHEYHVVPDRTRPMDLEVHSVRSVVGYGRKDDSRREFRPFYSCTERTPVEQDAAYYTVHRAARKASSRQRAQGPRSVYTGSEVFLALVDGQQGPYHPDLQQLGVDVLCTNRDLALHMTVGDGISDFTLLASGAPFDGVRCIAGPSEPHPSHAWGPTSWRLISHLSLNHLSITDGGDGRGAAALRELLQLYGDISDAATRRQIEGVRSVVTAPIVRRLPFPGPASFGHGLEITLGCDETAFEGTSVFLLGLVLESFFSKHASINSFTETVLRTSQRGEIVRWPARIGRRSIV
jgi:type VI secretion system protein ImpG